MKALAWYTIIYNGLLIIAFILTAAGLIEAPPFTVLEDLVWALFTVPVLILGILCIRRSK
ncbi:MAG: hypothetical protein HY665_05645 [Chloroflexi bacterium]|nr:hypothetical protein [Chloroflexota bacterium]